MSITVSSRQPDSSTTELSVSRAAAILGISAPVFRKGLKGGTIPGRDMGTIADLASREILTEVEVDGHPVPVLRPGLARAATNETRRFSGWKIDESVKATTIALDRWWTPPGRDQILGAGGYLVAVGSIVCAVIGDIDEANLQTQRDRINYNGTLAGVLRSRGAVKIVGNGDWADVARKVIGSRVLGGEGGNFTRV